MKHSNIAVFIPHLGCSHQCSFCNQRTISGAQRTPSPDEVKRTLEEALDSFQRDWSQTEIAFFGGSFTAIDPQQMCSFLEIAQSFVSQYRLKGIRISTRPDAVDKTVIKQLLQYGVTAVELGAQSMDDGVLLLNRRGHTAAQTAAAAGLIRSSGMELGLQMMIGLYGSDTQKDYETALKIADLSPDTVRIYPTVILRGTLLDEYYQTGKYRPMQLEEAVESAARMMRMFEQRGIRVIKVGLHASGQVEDEMSGGIYHPAFRELCESRIYLEYALKLIGDRKDQVIRLRVSPSAVSKMIGQRRMNLKQIGQKTGCVVFIKEDRLLSKYEIVLEE